MRETAADVYRVIGPYMGMTLEEFHAVLRQDSNPARVVLIWVFLAAAWKDYHEKYTAGVPMPQEEEVDILDAFVLHVNGVTDADELGVPPEVGRRLRDCCADWGLG